ncbi:hypothetical protein [Mucilaginibacter sp. UYCu711]|uniref:hypothetical protein n=1 Tax=Mucilaginibacter sp. UYCu711 TaxID=3156339 RepID=UPI003D1E0194
MNDGPNYIRKLFNELENHKKPVDGFIDEVFYQVKTGKTKQKQVEKKSDKWLKSRFIVFYVLIGSGLTLLLQWIFK